MIAHLNQNGLPIGSVECLRPNCWVIVPPYGIRNNGKRMYKTFNQACQALHTHNLSIAKLIMDAYGERHTIGEMP